MIKRAITKSLKKDLEDKLIILSGPRQVGKTTLSRSLYANYEYLNFDIKDERKMILEESFRKDLELVVFDEIHKMRKWKSYLKGIFDQKNNFKIITTGSARLDLFRKGGDSLAGRHYFYKLNPFSFHELSEKMNESEIISSLMNFGGFPEPLLKSDVNFAKKWRKSHIERVIRDDILGLEKKGDIRSLEILVELLQDRVGSTVSYNSLAEDLRVSIHTIKNWLEILEQLFIVFKVSPYSKSLSRSIQKESKYYFYDIAQNIDDSGKRFENLMACELKFYLEYLESTKGEKVSLHFIRDKEKREVDFLTVINKKPELLIEVKLSDTNFSKSLEYYNKKIKVKSIQVTLEKIRQKEKDSIKMMSAKDFLKEYLIYGSKD